MKEKAFAQLLIGLIKKPLKTKKALLQRHLNPIEKQIIQAYELLNRSENYHLLELLESLTSLPTSFMKGQRDYLLGMAYKNLGFYGMAQENLREALVKLEKYPHFELLCLINLLSVHQSQLDLQKKAS